MRILVGCAALLAVMASTARAEPSCERSSKRVGPCIEGTGWVYRARGQYLFISQQGAIDLEPAKTAVALQSTSSPAVHFSPPTIKVKDKDAPAVRAPATFKLVSEWDAKSAPILPENVKFMLSSLDSDNVLVGSVRICPLADWTQSPDQAVPACLSKTLSTLSIVSRSNVKQDGQGELAPVAPKQASPEKRTAAPKRPHAPKPAQTE